MKTKNIKLLLALGLFICSAINATAQTKIIAHRGYWDCEGSAQNSITALKKAAQQKVYGSEFDVSITKDDVLVVNHDPTIQGIEIEDSPYSAMKDLKLSNGETLPTLKNYLAEGKKHKAMKLILEIKPHKTEANENRAVKAVVAMVKEMKLTKKVEYISFSKNICQQILLLNPKAKIAYLKGDMTPEQVKEQGWTGIDYHFNVLRKNPEWISQAKKNKLTVNVWTVNKDEDIKEFINKKVDFITTNAPVKAMEEAK